MFPSDCRKRIDFMLKLVEAVRIEHLQEIPPFRGLASVVESRDRSAGDATNDFADVCKNGC